MAMMNSLRKVGPAVQRYFTLIHQNVLSLNQQRWTASLAETRKLLDKELQGIREAGTFKSERVITSSQGPSILVDGSQGDILNFCANNYLGLSNHPAVVEAGKKALDSHGAGLSSVRFICGTQDIHKDLEEKIAKFHGKEDAILYISCFDANAGIFEVLMSPEDAIISDELNHASIIDGIRLSKAQRLRYKHRDLADLESHLIATKDCRQRLIVTDGVFSMDGNVAPLTDICDLADKHNAMVFIDECHSTGFFGPTGRGTEEYFGLDGRVDIINSTLGKALGGAAGGYTAGPKQLVDLLRQRSRPYLFSNTLPPPVVATASKALDLVMENTDLPKKVLTNTTRFRTRMNDAGFTLSGDPEHPICPVMLGDARLASQFADQMLERGIYVIGFSFPVVPKGKARIRVQISASHTEQDIDRAVDAFIDIGRKLNVIN
ncbi:2-amino-3-ketobutyrate coenzyme A ligase, mitochondrial isoform X1 [Aplysia californica]|uniref:2-amino-3-ketobutyrate coenzyme A ligase, mitochondrial isoform X1 n=1 Tax=Aplysia californica TaxID=6500 RepID=A0ABM0JR23_APLCA|nr:2-amino-3-ketobutyrate coenzyme A ligase, mitochondrial isoform X2 [Aplysia californica]XP_005099526.1 2-amino-3-ketobutyrate coenzyme A ligase, mitochondrial isoform X1 [Aplysia californica]